MNNEVLGARQVSDKLHLWYEAGLVTAVPELEKHPETMYLLMPGGLLKLDRP
jgi:hypothetical protein